jgi:dihydropteroate synthase
MALSWLCRDRRLTFDNCPLIMGILNVTPDSFADGGRYNAQDMPSERGLQILAEGADILDVGGESTRPGADPVDADEEIRRVAPVIERVCREQPDAIVSIDTTKAAVAEAAIAAGASIINDVSALTHDPEMMDVAVQSGAGVVLMHMQGSPRTMQTEPGYDNVAAEISDYLGQRVDELVAAGLDAERLVVDPGIGFGKNVEHNLALLASLRQMSVRDRPVVVGLSRKSFLGLLTDRPVDQRMAGSLAALCFCVLNGAHVMRVHDVRESIDAVRVLQALAQATQTG